MTATSRTGPRSYNPNDAHRPVWAASPDDKYKYIAASQTDSALGADGGAVGDYLTGLLIVPASTSPGAVSIKDGSGSAITIFAGGASSVSDLKPFFAYHGFRSINGAWKVTTGANVSVIASGTFT